MFDDNYYGNFAYYYDELTQNVDYPKRAQYFHKLIENFGGKTDGTLLDVACGTGSISEEMAKLGYDVIGADVSEGMLNIALDKKFESGLNIQYVKQDMRELEMYGTLDNVLCVLDSLNHLPTLEDIQKTFERVALYTEPNGLYIFDMNTQYKHRVVLSDNAYVYETDSVFCAWENSYHPEDDRVDITLNFFERGEKGQYRRYVEEFSEWAYSVEDVLKVLDSVGFELLATYDDDTLNPVHAQSERIIFVTRKVR